MQTRANLSLPPLMRGVPTGRIVAGLLLFQAVVLGYSATRHSPTLDEPGLLASGIRIWEVGQFDLYRVNPPLVRGVAAAPVMLAGCRVDWTRLERSTMTRSEFVVGEDFVHANAERSILLVTLARWACIPFCLLGGVFCYLWSRRIWQSELAGILSLGLWTLEPFLIAHGELISTDCAATSLGLAAGYFFSSWLKDRSWKLAIVGGLALGLAGLTKLTWLILFALWPLLAHVWLALGRRIPDPRSQNDTKCHASYISLLAQLFVILAVALNVINLGYVFSGTLRPLKDFVFVSRMLTGTEKGDGPGNRFSGTILGEIPVPLPADFIVGLDLQKQDLESHQSQSYLLGEWQDGGWWYYYFYGLAVKTAHGTQFLMLLSITAVLAIDCRLVLSARRSQSTTEPERVDLFILLGTAVAVLILVSSQQEFNHHVRYVMPVLGFAIVFSGGAVRLAEATGSSGQRRIMAACISLCVISNLISLTCVYPHQLAYFNECSGGAAAGHRHLSHSNLDWGQSLLEFREWYRAHPDRRPVYLAYYGLFNPADLGLNETLPIPQDDGRQLASGWYAISESVLRAPGQLAYSSSGPTWYEQIGRRFAGASPVQSFGYSIHLYDIPERDGDQSLADAPE